jgi:VWFA-related protein
MGEPGMGLPKTRAAGLFTVWFCGLLLAVPILAQAPADPPVQEPTLRVTTRLVQVNVIVQDKKGEPVSNLTRSDFRLFDQGKEQPISIFSVESNQALSPPAQQLPPNTFSNRIEYRAGVPHSVTVILLDGLNTEFGDQASARNQIVKFLLQLQPQDRVALYALGRKLHILHNFTSDAAPLIRLLTQYEGYIPSELNASEPAQTAAGTQPEATSDMRSELTRGNLDLDAWLRESEQIMSDFYTVNRVRDTCAALEAIAQYLSRFPGRKNLIWVSAGFPIWIGLDS